MKLALDAIEVPANDARQGCAPLEADVRALADAITLTGWVAPLVVAETDEPGTYRLVAGHTRLAALRRLGRRKAEVQVVKHKSASLVHAAENLARRDLTFAQQAHLIAQLDREGSTLSEIAHAIGRSRSHVSTVRSIWLDLAPQIKTALERGEQIAFRKLQTWRTKPHDKQIQLYQAHRRPKEKEPKKERRQPARLTDAEWIEQLRSSRSRCDRHAWRVLEWYRGNGRRPSLAGRTRRG